MCTLTPCSEIPSSAAMSLLVLPRATFRRITCCLGVSGRWIGKERKYMYFRPLRAERSDGMAERALEMTPRHGANGLHGDGGSADRIRVCGPGAPGQERRSRRPPHDSRDGLGVLPFQRSHGRSRLEFERGGLD